MLTKGAMGNLVNRYRAVLKKCHLMNTFGSLAVAAMLVMGGAGVAGAAPVSSDTSLSTSSTLNTTNAAGTHDDVNIAGNLTVNYAGGGYGDILAGNVTVKGSIEAGDIMTYGNLTADYVTTYANSDDTEKASKKNPGTIEIKGTVNLPGDSLSGRRFDLENTVGSHNVLGNVTTGACMGLVGNGTEKSTLTGGVMTVRGGTFAVSRGMQATLKEVSFNITNRRARVHGENPNSATILDLGKLILCDGVLITESRWDSQYALAAVRELSPDDSKKGVLIGDGHIAVGSNAIIGLGEGATLDNVYGLMKKFTGYETPTKNDVCSALILDQPLELQDEHATPGNSYNVYISDEKHTEVAPAPYTTVNGEESSLANAVLGSAASSFTQEANTLLVVNGANEHVHYTTAAKASIPGAISYANGSAEAVIEDGAKLAITGAQAGETYVILGNGFEDITFGETAWTGDNLLSDNPLVALTRGDDGTVAGEAVAAAEALPGLDSGLAAAIDSANQAHLIGTGAQTSSGEAGTRFISIALSSGNAAAAADIINEVSRAAVTAGVQNTSLRIADAASNTVLDHLSFAGHTASVHSNGADFWAAPMYGNLYTNGMVTNGSSVRSQFGGLALGADIEAGNFRFGAAINGGGGQSETKGGVASTQNDYSFGGVNLYAGWTCESLNIFGSVGYAFGNHDVEMGLAGINTAKADVDTTAFTADLRAEYQLNTQYVDVLPHIGVRYTALKTDAYDLKVSGHALSKVQSDTQSIVQFPIGVTLSKTVAFADWNVKPMVDVSVIPAVGDKEANTKVKFSGIDAWSSMDSRIMDSTSWAGTVGIQAEKGSFSLGLNYGVQASSHETDQNVQIKLGWKF